MVSFQCDGCSDVIKKPKLDQHRGRCNSSFTCLDCSKTFPSPSDYQGHTSCVTEAEKYEKSVYQGPRHNGNTHGLNGSSRGRGGFSSYRGGYGGGNAGQGRWPPVNRGTGVNGMPLGTNSKMTWTPPSPTPERVVEEFKSEKRKLEVAAPETQKPADQPPQKRHKKFEAQTAHVDQPSLEEQSNESNITTTKPIEVAKNDRPLKGEKKEKKGKKNDRKVQSSEPVDVNSSVDHSSSLGIVSGNPTEPTREERKLLKKQAKAEKKERKRAKEAAKDTTLVHDSPSASETAVEVDEPSAKPPKASIGHALDVDAELSGARPQKEGRRDKKDKSERKRKSEGGDDIPEIKRKNKKSKVGKAELLTADN